MAQLVVEVTDKGITKTEASLKKMATSGASAEKAVDKLKSSSVKADRIIDRMKKTTDRAGIGFSDLEAKAKSFGRNSAAAIALIDGPLGGVSSRVSAFTTVLTEGTAAVTLAAVGVAAFTAAVYKGVSALDQYESDLIRVDAVLRATGNGAGFTAEQLRKQADALALATLTSTTEVQKAQAKLLTFNRVIGDTFSNAIALSQDLAEVGFGDIASNATQLGKALQDPIQGITALTRVGVTFTDSQKNQITNLIKQNDLFKAQEALLKAVEDQVGGTAEAVAGTTLSGSLDTLGQRIEEMTRRLAEMTGAASGAKYVIDRIAAGMNIFTTETLKSDTAADKFKETLDKTFELRKAEDLLEAMHKFTPAWKEQAEKVKKLREEVAILRGETSELAEKEADGIRERAKARQGEIDAQKRINKEVAEENEAAAKKEKDAKEKKLAAERAREQAAVDASVESIRRSLLTKDELRMEDLLRNQEAIESSSLSEAQQIEVKKALWRNYNDWLSDQADQRQAREEKQAASDKRRDEQIMKAKQRAQMSALGGMTEDLKSVLGEQNDLYKAAAVTQTLISTYSSATKSYDALASIPVVGPALGFAAAGAAVAAGLANVAAITSARAQGGQVNAGQPYLVGERGPEVVQFGHSGRMASNVETRGMMGGSVQNNIYIQNAPAGTTVTKQPNSTGGEDTYVTINELDERVGQLAGNPNSDMRGALDRQYKQA